jgi:hypothetical protein
MFGSVILDVAVGLILTYLLLSLIATSIRESIAGFLNTRAKTLHQGLGELLGDAQLVADLYNHPVINSLYRGSDYTDAYKKNKLPAYIPAKSFSAALVDMIVRGRDTTSVLQSGSEARLITVGNVRAQIGRINNVRVQRAVLSAVDAANGDLNALYANLEHWFDSTMDRVSGWYKRHTQLYLFVIGFALTVIADADTIRISARLYGDPNQRQAAIAIASNVRKDSIGSDVAKMAAADLQKLGLPVTGWQEERLSFLDDFGGSVKKIGNRALSAWLGWLLTSLAIALGAPFWFDTLGRIMIIRNTVKPTQKSPNEASDDRQVSTSMGGSSSSGGNPPAPRSPVSPPPILPPVVTPAPVLAEFHPQEWAAGHPDAGVI